MVVQLEVEAAKNQDFSNKLLCCCSKVDLVDEEKVRRPVKRIARKTSKTAVSTKNDNVQPNANHEANASNSKEEIRLI